jgi:hypothetical protein
MRKKSKNSQVQLYVGIWSVKSGTFLESSYFANSTTHLFIYINATINFFSPFIIIIIIIIIIIFIKKNTIILDLLI